MILFIITGFGHMLPSACPTASGQNAPKSSRTKKRANICHIILYRAI